MKQKFTKIGLLAILLTQAILNLAQEEPIYGDAPCGQLFLTTQRATGISLPDVSSESNAITFANQGVGLTDATRSPKPDAINGDMILDASGNHAFNKASEDTDNFKIRGKTASSNENDLAYQETIQKNQEESDDCIHTASFKFHFAEGENTDSNDQHETTDETWIFNPQNKSSSYISKPSSVDMASIQYSIEGELPGHAEPYDEEARQLIPETTTARAILSISAFPSSVLCGTNGVVTLSVDESSFSYASNIYWYRNGAIIPNTSGNQNIFETQSGTYQADIVISGVTYKTNIIELTRNSTSINTPYISSIGDIYELTYENTSIKLNLASSSILPGQTYLWFKNDEPLYNQTSPQIIVDKEGVYKVLVSDNNCSVFSISRSIVDRYSPEYDLPLNIIPADAECIDNMPKNVTFGIHTKFNTPTTPESCYIDGFSIPLVGDLDSDGKPEMVALGITKGTSLDAYGRYINVFDGQTGVLLTSFDLQSLGADYASGNQFRLRSTPYHGSPSQLAIADVDRDGLTEVIVVETGTNGRIYCLKPTINIYTRLINGFTKMWDGSVGHKAPLTTDNDWADGFGPAMPYITDLNGDGIPEVIVNNKIYNAQTGALLMAWDGPAYNWRPSSLSSGTGLYYAGYSDDHYITPSASDNIRNHALIGRRPGYNVYADQYNQVKAIVDIDDDGELEIIAGTRIHKFQFNSLTNHIFNNYKTIEGPTSVDVPVNSNGSEKKTFYLSDGFTRVADIDGDGQLEILYFTHVRRTRSYVGLIAAWNYHPSNGTIETKAVTTYYADGDHGNFSIPFIGDINGKSDGWDGFRYSKKLPEICLTTGALYINRSNASVAGRSGIPFHPLSDETLRRGTAGNSGTAAGWDNNQTNNSNRVFNRDNDRTTRGHVFALTYDAREPLIENRLKLSWALGHQDNSNITGITMFDFDNDGAKDLCYRDVYTIRVISPKKGGADYIPSTATETHPSILFRTDCYSRTGFEAPAIADVNMDGSANIIVTNRPSGDNGSSGPTRSFITVYEYAPGYQKWAPCPPVWNQGLYDPLHINANLTVPTKPQPILTYYLDDDGNIITPYNASWTQQPIVKAGHRYVPVVRQPDAILSNMKVRINFTGQYPTSATVTLTIRNTGTASINANTPIAFYANAVNVDNFASATFIQTLIVGRDIFPGETYEREYTITGQFNNRIIWARIIDDGGHFPATNYMDCNLSNNLMKGIDCPYLVYAISATPSSATLCGDSASVMLIANPASPSQHTPIYQWYINDQVINDATSQIYFANEPGIYKCYVIENICQGFTINEINVKNGYGNINTPRLQAFPNNIICGNTGNVNLQVTNSYDYPSSAIYYWIKDSVLYRQGTNPYLNTNEAGNYQVYVVIGSCGNHSEDVVNLIRDDNHSINPPTISSTPDRMCQYGGKALLTMLTPPSSSVASYQWYYENVPISGANLSWYIAGRQGTYTLQITNTAGCSAFSSGLTVPLIIEGEIEVPQLGKIPADATELCQGGNMLLYVSNTDKYLATAQYIWYKDGKIIYQGTGLDYAAYQVTEGGDYVVMIKSSNCTSISDIEEIRHSENSIDNISIHSTYEIYELCGPQSIVALRIQAEYIKAGQTYLWFKDGIPQYDQTDYGYVVRTPGRYKVLVAEGNCSIFSNEQEITQGTTTNFRAPVLTLEPPNGKICEEDGSALLYVSNYIEYGDNPTYRWYRGSEMVQASNNPLYFATIEGSYMVRVVANGCSAISDNFITVAKSETGEIKKPVITSPSGTHYVCGNHGVLILQVENIVSNLQNVQYVWYKDGKVISDLGLNMPTFRATAEGKYQVRLIDGECSALSDPFDVLTYEDNNMPEPVFQRYPASGQICGNNGSILLLVYNASSYINPAFIWYRNDVIVQTGGKYSYEATEEGRYYVQIVSGECSKITETFNLTKNNNTISNPQIASTTGNNALCGGEGVVVMKLTNTIVGALSYQWFKNDMPIAGANEPLYIAREQGVYRLLVSTGSCSALSNNINVESSGGIINNSPELELDPSNNVCINSVVQIRIKNHNILFPNATFIWFKDNEILSGQTSPVLYAREPGVYFAQIYDANGCSAVSGFETITQSGNSIRIPEMSIIPSSQNICGPNGTVIIRLQNPEDFNNPSYQWFKDEQSIIGETKLLLIVDATMGAGHYRLQITDGNGCITYSYRFDVEYLNGSSAVKPVLIPDPVADLTADPMTGTIYVGGQMPDKALLTVAVDPNAIEYRWYSHEGFLKVSAPPFGVEVTHTITLNDELVSGTYFVQAIYNNGCAANSKSYHLEVNGAYLNPPQLKSTPESNNICNDNEGKGMAFIEVINHHEYINPVYQWYRNGVALQGTEATTEPLLVTDIAGVYTATVTAAPTVGSPTVTSAPSQPVTLTVSGSIAKPNLKNIGKDICNANSGGAILHITNYTDYSNPEYTWTKDGVVILTENTPSLVATETGAYTVAVLDGSCWTMSENITVSPGAGSITKPEIHILGSANLQICGREGTVILKLKSPQNYTNATFQWFRNNIPLENETDSILRATWDNSGVSTIDKYRLQVVMNESGCTGLSDPIQVNTYEIPTVKPVIKSDPYGAQICGNNGEILLYVENASSFIGATYYWIKDGIYYTAGVDLDRCFVTETGSYTVYVVGNPCASESLPFVIFQGGTNITKPVVNSEGGNDLCAGNSAQLLRLNMETIPYSNPQYQWYKGTTKIANATKPYYFAAADGEYKLQVVDGNCSSFSSSIIINPKSISGYMVQKPILEIIPNAKIICENGIVLIKVSNASSFNPDQTTFIWYNGNNERLNETSSALYVDKPGIYFVHVLSNGCSSISEEIEIMPSSSSVHSPVELVTSPPNVNFICDNYGSVVIGLANPENYQGMSLQWFKDNAPIVPTQSERYYTATEGGTYRLRIYDGNCSTFSDPISLTERPGGATTQPDFTASASTVICGEYGSVMLTVKDHQDYATGTKFVWFHENSIIKEGTEPFYEAIGSQAKGRYYLQAIFPDGCVALSEYKTLTYDANSPFEDRPEINSEPLQNNICGDYGVVVLSLRERDDLIGDNITYRWYKNNISIVGATSKIYRAREAGSYRLRISYGDCSVISDPVEVTKTASDRKEPQLTIDPQNGQICGIYSSVLLSVANPEDFSQGSIYIWFNGNTVVERGADLTIYEAKTEGDYSVVVVDGACATISKEQEVNNSPFGDIKNDPIISAIPYPDYKICGENGVVVLTFENPDMFEGYAIQWYNGRDPISGSEGQQTVYYATETGSYRIRVALENCAAFSTSIEVESNPSGSIEKPHLNMNPPTGYLCTDGGSVIIYVENSDQYQSGSLYKWYRGTTIVEEGIDMDEYETATIGNYHVVVLEGNCASMSLPANVVSGGGSTIKPRIYSTSGDNNICEENGSIILMLENRSDYSEFVTFRWHDQNNNIIGNATDPLLIVTTAGEYRIEVIEGNCSGFSMPFEVTKDGGGNINAPTLLKSPVNGELCGPESSVALYVENADMLYPEATYNWFRNNELLTESSSLIYVEEEGVYFVQVVDKDCSAASSLVEITSSSSILTVSISSNTENYHLCDGNGKLILRMDDHLSTEYIGAIFQWYKDELLLPNENSYMLIVTDAGSYKLYVEVGNCSAYSQSTSINEYGGGNEINEPTFSTVPASGELCGSNSFVEIAVSNHNLYESGTSYFWYKDETPIQGNNTHILTVREAGNYLVEVYDGICTTVGAIVISAGSSSLETPVIASTTNQSQLCEDGGSILLNLNNQVNYAPYGALEFQWLKNGVKIDSELGRNEIYLATEEGAYSLYLSVSGCVLISNTYHVVKSESNTIDPPAIAQEPESGNLCGESSIVTLSVSNFEGASFAWYKDYMNTVIATTPEIKVSEAGTYLVVVQSGACTTAGVVEVENHETSLDAPVIGSTNGTNIWCTENGNVLVALLNKESYSGKNISLQWFRNDEKITGAEGEREMLIVNDNATYQLKISIDGCILVSNSITLIPNVAMIDPVAFDTKPQTGTLCGENSQVTITETTFGALGATYEWFKDFVYGTPLSTTSSYTATEAGTYIAVVSFNGCTNVGVIEIKDSGSNFGAPFIGAVNGSNIICSIGGKSLLSILNKEEYAGYEVAYQWFKNDIKIAGVEGSREMLIVEDTGKYQLQITVEGCILASNIIKLIANVAMIENPVFTIDPESATLCGKGSKVVISETKYVALGATYQWYKDFIHGTPLSVTSTYTVTQAGVYVVVVSANSCTTVGTIEVNDSGATIDAPEIGTVNGTNILCTLGGKAILSILNKENYSGQNISYQWLRNGVKMTGAEGSREMLIVNDDQEYQLQITIDGCILVSNIIKLTPNIAMIGDPAFTTDPETKMLCGNGSQVTINETNFSAMSSASYQWYKDFTYSDPLSVTSTYTATEEGIYIAVITVSNCTSIGIIEIRQSATQFEKPAIASTTGQTKLCEDGGLLLHLSNASMYAPSSIDYQWIKNGVDITGELGTKKTLIVKESGDYQLRITVDECIMRSDVLTIDPVSGDVIDKLIVSRDPVNGTLCGDNSFVILTVETAYPGGTTYAWYKNYEDNIIGTEESLTVSETGNYFVVVKSGGCTAVSDIEEVIDGTALLVTIASLHGETKICEPNGKVILALVNPDHYAGATYQWYKGLTPITGATDNWHIAEKADNYRLHVKQNACSVFSNTITLGEGTGTITPPTVISMPSTGSTICGKYGVVVLSLNNASSYASYQWYQNNQIITGEDKFQLSATTNGVYYVRVVDDNGCSSISSPIVVNYDETGSIERPEISVTPPSIPNGGNVTVTIDNATTDYSADVIFYWYRGTEELVAERGNTVITTNVEGIYKVLAVDGECASWSMNINIENDGCSMPGIPNLVAIPSSLKVCNGGSVLLQLENKDAFIDHQPTYEWYLNGAAIAGNTPALEVTQAGNYQIKVIISVPSTCSAYSSAITVEKGANSINTPEISSLANAGKICGKEGSVILRFENPEDFTNGTETYRWFKDNYAYDNNTYNINDKQGYILTVSTPGKYRLVVLDGECAALSTEKEIIFDGNTEIAKPIISKIPDEKNICVGGFIKLTVSTVQAYVAPQYIWYRDSEVVQQGSEASYFAEEAGIYFVQVVDGGCSSTSQPEVITMSTQQIATPQLSTYPNLQNPNICGAEGAVTIRVTNSEEYQNPAYQWYEGT
ncbi:MAG: hypothetical protein LBH92_04430, partial [Bacteroidales bacterium]|nr:hypothetical protein [Bacteroidales bacterium]